MTFAYCHLQELAHRRAVVPQRSFVESTGLERGSSGGHMKQLHRICVHVCAGWCQPLLRLLHFPEQKAVSPVSCDGFP